MSGPSESARHEAGHGEVDQRLAGVAEELVLRAEAALAEPRERPLHCPPARHHAPKADPLRRQATPLNWPQINARPERDRFTTRLRQVRLQGGILGVGQVAGIGSSLHAREAAGGGPGPFSHRL
jgi:hypothetical protein